MTRCIHMYTEVSMKKINVLVVDDEKDVYLSTKLALQLLTNDGIDVSVAYCESASHAIQVLKESSFELIILDIIMESLHAGYQVIDYVNQHHGDAGIAIYIRSGQPGNVPDKYVSLLDNVDGYIHKTECTMAKLHEIVKSVV